MKKAYRVAVSWVAAVAICAGLGVGGSFVPAIAAKGEKTRERAARALREGEFEAAEKLYREMLSKNARDREARLGLSFAFLKQRKHQDAFDAAARVATADPESARAHALLGATLLGVGDFRLSVEAFRTALSLKENEALAINGLAMVDFYESRLTRSLAGLRRAAFLAPDEPDYHFNLGQVAARSEQYAEAADSYERFLRVAPRADADRRARIRGLIDFLRYLGTQRSLLRAEGAARVEVPFELTNNRPIINVRINGSKELLRFVIDTGAGMCVLSDTAAARIGVRAVARGGNARAVGGGGRFEILYGFLQSLHFGDARVENVPIYIRPFTNTQEKVDGYVGLSIIAKYLSILDYQSRVMTLMRDGERAVVDVAATTPGLEMPIRTTSSGFWSGEVQVDGIEKPLNFIMDTGASISVVSEALAEREEMNRYAQQTKLKVYGAAGVSHDVQMLLLPRITLGSQARKNVPAAVLDLNPINETSGFEQTGIIGGNVLRHFRVTFDFQRAVVRLDPPRPPAPPANPASQSFVGRPQS